MSVDVPSNRAASRVLHWGLWSSGLRLAERLSGPQRTEVPGMNPAGQPERVQTSRRTWWWFGVPARRLSHRRRDQAKATTGLKLLGRHRVGWITYLRSTMGWVWWCIMGRFPLFLRCRQVCTDNPSPLRLVLINFQVVKFTFKELNRRCYGYFNFLSLPLPYNSMFCGFVPPLYFLEKVTWCLLLLERTRFWFYLFYCFSVFQLINFSCSSSILEVDVYFTYFHSFSDLPLYFNRRRKENPRVKFKQSLWLLATAALLPTTCRQDASSSKSW